MFRVKERYRLQVRAEFFNFFNRIVMPLAINCRRKPKAPQTCRQRALGALVVSTISGQRNGQIVARVEF